MAPAVAIAWLAAGGGAAWAAWSQPLRLSPRGREASYPQVGLDGRRDATVVWMAGAGRSSVIVSSRRVAGAWTRPRRLSPPGRSAEWPQIGVDPAGEAVAVWQAGHGIDAVVRRRPGEHWTGPVRVAAAPDLSGGPEIAIDIRRRVALVVWSVSGAHSSKIEVSRLDLAKGGWSAPAVLARSTRPLYGPRLAIGSDGQAVAVWKAYVRGGPVNPQGTVNRVGAAVLPVGDARWSKAADLGREVEPRGQGLDSTESPGPRVAGDGGAGALAVWQGGNYRHVVTAAAWWNPRRRAWSSLPPISHRYALMPVVAADARGSVTLGWRDGDGRMEAASARLPFGGWSRPRVLSREYPINPIVAADGRGEAIAAWGGGRVQAVVRRGQARRWSRRVTIGPGGGAALTLAVDGRGDAVVAWQQRSGNADVIEVASYGSP